MAKKLPKRPKPTPKPASEAPRIPSGPSKALEAPPVPPTYPKVLDGHWFDVVWGNLSPRGKAKVRHVAESRGITLRGALNGWPELRDG